MTTADAGRVRCALTPLGHAIAGMPAVSPGLDAALAEPPGKMSDAGRAALVSAFHRSRVAVENQHPVAIEFRDRILRRYGGLAMSLIAQVLPEGEIRTTRVLPRGDWRDTSGDLAPPATPHFLPQPAERAERLTRLDLADWITSKENPLTPRHYVNRIWRHFFGTGLSAKLDDLGNQGEWPSHPLLLDWLASEFVSSGWDMKHVARLIVSSRTYRQEAAHRSDLLEIDPYNRLLAQQSPRRLEAEIIRDNALAISGLLMADYIGGPSVRPYQPDGHYDNLQFPNRTYVANRDSLQYRRGVYMHWQRTFLHPMLVNFDAPSRDECTAERSVSNSPQQSLTLLNDPTFVEASRALAARLIVEHPGAAFDRRLDAAFALALARAPADDERAALRDLWKAQRDYYREHPADANQLLAVGLAPVPADLDAVDVAAWAQVCRVLLNLHETITRY